MAAVQSRWEQKLAGSYSGPAGEWDRFVLLALRLGWSEQEIWQSSPDFLDEITARLNAEAAVRLSLAAGGFARKPGKAPVSAEVKRAKALAWARSQNAAAIRRMSKTRH